MAAIKATGTAKAAGAFMAGAGVLSLVLALQAAIVLMVRGPYQLVEVLFTLLGLVGVFAGAKLAGMRSLGAWLSIVTGALLALSSLGWFLLAMSRGVFVVPALFLVPLAAVASGLAAANLDATGRADDARSRLRAQGLDAGF
jgi:hypothetical protein